MELQSRSGKKVMIDLDNSHAATHLKEQPNLLELVKRIISNTDLPEIDDKFYSFETDTGYTIGEMDLVETDNNDEIIYAKRKNRNNFTRFVKNKPRPKTSFVSIVIKKNDNETLELWSAWIGRLVPPFPGDEHEQPESKSFWEKHALVWGTQAIEPGTETSEKPW